MVFSKEAAPCITNFVHAVLCIRMEDEKYMKIAIAQLDQYKA